MEIMQEKLLKILPKRNETKLNKQNSRTSPSNLNLLERTEHAQTVSLARQ